MPECRMSRPRPRPHIAASGSWSRRMTYHRGTAPATASGTRARSLAVMAARAPAMPRTPWGTAIAWLRRTVWRWAPFNARCNRSWKAGSSTSASSKAATTSRMRPSVRRVRAWLTGPPHEPRPLLPATPTAPGHRAGGTAWPGCRARRASTTPSTAPRLAKSWATSAAVVAVCIPIIRRNPARSASHASRIASTAAPAASRSGTGSASENGPPRIMIGWFMTRASQLSTRRR